MARFNHDAKGASMIMPHDLDPIVKVLNELVDVQYKIANELAQMNLILDNKKDVGDYDPIWRDIPGMEKSGG